MPTITETLTMEHGVFCRLFNQIERMSPPPQSLAEIQMLGRLIEGLLTDHSDIENNLAYLALDHALADRGQLDRLYEDHREIDSHFRELREAQDPAGAQRLLQKAIAAMRKHFQREEQQVFPLMNAALKSDTLTQLAVASKSRSFVGVSA
jgi:hemerythrin-like domain-containing protein